MFDGISFPCSQVAQVAAVVPLRRQRLIYPAQSRLSNHGLATKGARTSATNWIVPCCSECSESHIWKVDFATQIFRLLRIHIIWWYANALYFNSPYFHPWNSISLERNTAVFLYSIDVVLTYSWWRHQMETFSALPALCEGNPPVTGGSPRKGQWQW